MPGWRAFRRTAACGALELTRSFQRFQEADPVDFLLIDAIHGTRLRNVRGLKDCGEHIDHVRVLRNAPPPRSWTWPGQGDDHGIPGLPPRCEPKRLPHWNGVLPAHAHPTG